MTVSENRKEAGAGIMRLVRGGLEAWHHRAPLLLLLLTAALTASAPASRCGLPPCANRGAPRINDLTKVKIFVGYEAFASMNARATPWCNLYLCQFFVEVAQHVHHQHVLAWRASLLLGGGGHFPLLKMGGIANPQPPLN